MPKFLWKCILSISIYEVWLHACYLYVSEEAKAKYGADEITEPYSLESY